MSKRTLADEVRSVLLAHSLDAPDPQPTVDRILADTTDQAGSGPTGQPAVPIAARRRWRPSGQLLGAAAVIALVVLGAAGINSLRHGSGQNSGAANSAARPAAGNADAGQPQSSQSPRSSQSLKRPNVATAPGFAANPPAPTDLGCASIPNGLVTVGAHTTFTLSTTGETRSVYEFYCVGSNGRRGASEVQVFGVQDGKLSYLSTLVPVSGAGHLDYLSSIPDGVTVQGTDNSAGDRPGDLISVNYTTKDGGRTFTSVGKIVAKACQQADLTVRVVTADGGVTGQHQVLQLTNHTVYPCALEGFPELVATLDGRPVGSISPALSGPSGGVTKAKVAPIVNLIPGGTAGAIIEYATVHPTCAPGNRLSVTLPTGVSLGSVPATLSPCGLFVHPLVDNAEGMN